ncbi:MAG: hypothetical protein CMJ81_19130 [Planctomycetaceae bacterium]|nr:hypothetical protein [Planctomycetaceae bacterium]MBP61644.1 hypothetical protein [Planctomycetaceae bacterium]
MAKRNKQRSAAAVTGNPDPMERVQEVRALGEQHLSAPRPFRRNVFFLVACGLMLAGWLLFLLVLAGIEVFRQG